MDTLLWGALAVGIDNHLWMHPAVGIYRDKRIAIE
jgi:hypothetical protein